MTCEDWNDLKNGKLIIVITFSLLNPFQPPVCPDLRLLKGCLKAIKYPESFLAPSKGWKLIVLYSNPARTDIIVS